MRKQKPISDDSKDKNSRWGRVAVALFGLLFLSVGLSIYYYDGLKPYLQKRQSANWPTAECQVLKAKKQVHHGDDSTTYTVDFYYTFKVDRQVFSGKRYSFANANVSQKEVNRQMKAFPADSSRQCCYNPQDPSDCVLDRTNQDQDWCSIFCPFVFITLGGAVMIGAFFFRRTGDKNAIPGSTTGNTPIAARFGDGMLASGGAAVALGGAKATFDNAADQLDAQWDGPLELKPAGSRWKQLGFIAACTLFWNGLVAAFVFGSDLLQNFGGANIGIQLFMLPFGLAGLLMIIATLYCVVAIFNPTVGIALSRGAVPLGGTVDVAWQIKGSYERIKKLTIHVQALQQAIYTRGSDMTKDIEVFEKLLVTEATDVTDVAFGSTSITIPADSMHTFHAQRNQIKWQVIVQGEISWAPDIYEHYDFRVTPIKLELRSS